MVVSSRRRAGIVAFFKKAKGRHWRVFPRRRRAGTGAFFNDANCKKAKGKHGRVFREGDGLALTRFFLKAKGWHWRVTS